MLVRKKGKTNLSSFMYGTFPQAYLSSLHDPRRAEVALVTEAEDSLKGSLASQLVTLCMVSPRLTSRGLCLVHLHDLPSTTLCSRSSCSTPMPFGFHSPHPGIVLCPAPHACHLLKGRNNTQSVSLCGPNMALRTLANVAGMLWGFTLPDVNLPTTPGGMRNEYPVYILQIRLPRHLEKLKACLA